MTQRGAFLRWSSIALGSCVALAACTRYEDDVDVAVSVPPREQFPPVHAVLELHCGTLDCHGSPARNLRIYGVFGLRANGTDVSGSPDTTAAEVDATYDAVASVDPEALGAVFMDRGRDPERWLVVRKSRGVEDHKGGSQLPSGSPGDRCLIAWIAGRATADACNADVFGPMPRDGGTW
jgi:hypothetical protein